jgi:enoyl-CoA hydratase/carnithine racemase
MTSAMPRAQFPHVEADSVGVTRVADGVVVVRIQSEPLGVLRQGVKRALRAALAELETDRGVRAIVLTGRGRAFSVGSDVREFQQDATWQRSAAEMDQGLSFDIEASRLPVIAACNGLTLGGGNELALACDIRLAAVSARFGFPEVKVAAFASAGGTQRLPQIVGAGRAMELLLTGRMFDAAEAERIGMVQEVVADDQLEARAVALGAEIASFPPLAVEATKRSAITGLQRGRQAGTEVENEMTVELGQTADAAEGQAAFIEKRPPRFNIAV